MTFLRTQGVSVPTCFDEEDIAAFAKRIITKVESDPNAHFAINYWVTLEFAEAIRVAVNEYYERNVSTTELMPTQISALAVISLQDSILYGAWSETFSQYNCYAFSIGKTYWLDPGKLAYDEKQKDNPIAPAYELDTLDAYTLADYAKSDLETQGWTRFIIQNESLVVDDMCSNEFVICVRSGDLDYHFMRYYNGVWLHKPGGTHTLQYKYTPSNDLEWTNEAVIRGEYREYDLIYDGPIVYIRYNSHDFTSYANHNTGTHTKYCSKCDYFESERCSLRYVSNGTAGHYQTCSLCGYRSDTTAHTMEYEHNGASGHTGSCTNCSYTASGSSCNTTTEYTGDGTTHTHEETCSYCDHVYTTASCTLSFEYSHTTNDVNYHHKICTVCNYEAIAPVQCSYKGTSTLCFVCQWPKGIGSGAAKAKTPGAELEITASNE